MPATRLRSGSIVTIRTYESRPLTRRLARAWLYSVLVVAIVVFGTGLQSYVELTMRGEENINVWRMVRWRLIWWFGWTLIAPLVFEFVRRYPLRREGWPATVLLLVAGNVVAYTLHVAIQVAAMYLPAYQMVHDSLPEAIRYHITISLYLNVFIYWVIVLVANALRAYGETQRVALRAANLEAQLANARLDALQMQLHPHFLFNTLHGISTLMYRDVRAADAMVSRLSKLLRRVLDTSDRHEVSLEEELDFVEEYLNVERTRFGDRLDVEFDIQPETRTLAVPTFVLQPLVENAIKHGVAANGNRGRIQIVARRTDGRLEVSVADDGPGIPADEAIMDAGVGLSNLTDRLSRMYDDQARLDLSNVPGGGFRARVVLPIRRSSR